LISSTLQLLFGILAKRADIILAATRG